MLIDKKTRKIICTHVRELSHMWQKAKGLMFSRGISDDVCYFFSFSSVRRMHIHMFFVRFPIDVIFLDAQMRVVELARLHPWKLYTSQEKAQYFIEVNAGVVRRRKIKLGDELEKY